MSQAVWTRLPAMKLLLANGTTSCRAHCVQTRNILVKTLVFSFYDDKLARILSWTKNLDAEIFPIKNPAVLATTGFFVL
jgi:hypothetical protein